MIWLRRSFFMIVALLPPEKRLLRRTSRTFFLSQQMPVRTRPEKQGKMFICYFIPLTLFCQEKKARNRLIVRLYENCILFSAKHRASRGRLPNLPGGSVPASSARIRRFVRMKQISCYFASEKCPNMLFTNLLCTFNKSIFIFLANTPC